MLCPWEHDAPSPVLHQKVVFRVKVMVTPKPQTNWDHGTAGYLHAAELILITQLLPNGTCSFNSRAAAFLQ